MEPAPNQLPLLQGSSLPRQNEESSLEGVLDVVWIVEQALANPQYHWAMPGEQDREGGLISNLDEPIEQIGIAGTPRWIGRRAQVSQQRLNGLAHARITLPCRV